MAFSKRGNIPLASVSFFLSNGQEEVYPGIPGPHPVICFDPNHEKKETHHVAQTGDYTRFSETKDETTKKLGISCIEPRLEIKPFAFSRRTHVCLTKSRTRPLHPAQEPLVRLLWIALTGCPESSSDLTVATTKYNQEADRTLEGSTLGRKFHTPPVQNPVSPNESWIRGSEVLQARCDQLHP